jgi:hypothetical protein
VLALVEALVVPRFSGVVRSGRPAISRSPRSRILMKPLSSTISASCPTCPSEITWLVRVGTAYTRSPLVRALLPQQKR